METKYLMDTNVVIDFLGGKISRPGNRWLQNIIDHNNQYLSVINQIELLGFNGQETEMKILEGVY